ncbi:hypothetical protein C8R45DRAFT_1099762 [Mycena sanguinolenta]|nr:hypothetical protein C8R45DRAFT_1099762 [Mycena sanguinolenta]
MSSSVNIVLVDTIPLLHSCIAALANTTSHATSDNDTIWLVNGVVRRADAFDVTGAGGQLLSDLSWRVVPSKRNDSDALFNLFRVSLANLYDLQLLEVAVRSSKPGARPRFLKGLVATLETYIAQKKPAAVVRKWARVKEAGLRLFAPDHGGRYEVFGNRLLAPALVKYCAQDVALLHDLELALSERLGPQREKWEKKMRAESMVRVDVARLANYAPRGKNKARVPKNW